MQIWRTTWSAPGMSHMKSGFHQKSAYDQVKSWSLKQGRTLDGIGFVRIRTFSFLAIPFTTPSLMIQWKLDCRSWKQKRKNQQITRSGIERCDWFTLPLLFPTPTMFSLVVSERAADRIGVLHCTLLVWFSKDRIVLRFRLWLRLRLSLSLVKTSLESEAS